jgi:hypothetical protein
MKRNKVYIKRRFKFAVFIGSRSFIALTKPISQYWLIGKLVG